MHVILGADAIHSPLTGIGRYAFELARNLRQLACVERLEFFSMGRWKRWDDLEQVQDLELAIAPEAPAQSRTLRSVLANNAYAVHLYQLCTPSIYQWRLRRSADALFHSPNYFLPRHPGRTVATIHDLSHIRYPQFHPAVRVDFMNRALPDTFKRADFLITDAESVRQEVINHYGWPADKIKAVPLGVDSGFMPRTAVDLQPVLQRFGLTAGGYSLFVGTIEPRKNIERLITAYAQLPESDRMRWPLVIVGSRGWHSDQIHQRMVQAARAGWLKYLAYVGQADLPHLFSGARLFAYPSLYEGFGLPPLEAMASGVPVLTSNVSSLPEVVGDAAIKVNPLDVDEIRRALQRGLADDVWRSQAVTAGLKIARELTWARCASNTAEIYGLVAST